MGNQSSGFSVGHQTISVFVAVLGLISAVVAFAWPASLAVNFAICQCLLLVMFLLLSVQETARSTDQTELRLSVLDQEKRNTELTAKLAAAYGEQTDEIRAGTKLMKQYKELEQQHDQLLKHCEQLRRDNVWLRQPGPDN